MTLVLVRHAWAGKRSHWRGDDRLRPLDDRGRRQAAELLEVLGGVEIERIVSSPYLRCVQTVEPLAAERGLEVEPVDALGEDIQGTAGVELLRELVSGAAVACVHGGIDEALGVSLRFPKGAVWLFGDVLADPRVLA